ncbi:MAG TPA: recombinase family protein, partial [Lachnospiraceae bacterium]|nr:recombinase family protein [Lachnospiraceae bacterium]
MLKDEVYVGVLAQGKRTRINHKVKKEVLVPKCDWIIIENAHESIVSKA